MGLFGSIGGAIKAVADIGPVGLLTGKGPLSKALGLTGEQGEYFSPYEQNPNLNKALDQLNDRNALITDPNANTVISDYGKGTTSLAEALGGTYRSLTPLQQDELRNMLALDPMAGSRLASDQIAGNPILGRLYGSDKESALSRALAEERELASRGFSLQPEDHEAFGQISGDIARQFGQEETALAQALADRGLASAPSGAAIKGFSGLAGNKNERLAKAQLEIADRRMQRNFERLNSVRDHARALGGAAGSEVEAQFRRNLAGALQKRANLENTADAQVRHNANLNTAVANANDYGLKSMKDKRDAKGKTLLEGLGRGLFKGAEAAPGMALNTAMPGAGKAIA